LQKVRALDGNVQIGLIIGPKTGFIFPVMMALANRLKVHSIHPAYTLITPAHMKSMRRIGAKVYTWTVNDVHEFMVVKGMGVDGVFTDYPNIIK
jgi:glycerophosphoryl diester phosphodiesterase